MPLHNIASWGIQKKELEIDLEKTLAEIEKSSSMSVLSALEAIFRIDYLLRNYRRKRDPLSKKLISLYRRRGERASLEDEILPVWREYRPDYDSVISELVDAFKYRHWLAHGRYWIPKLGRDYAYHDLFQIAYGLFNGLDLEVYSDS